jgi:hypothetical protein
MMQRVASPNLHVPSAMHGSAVHQAAVAACRSPVAEHGATTHRDITEFSCDACAKHACTRGASNKACMCHHQQQWCFCLFVLEAML